MALNLQGSSIGFDENAATLAVELARGHVVDGTRTILLVREGATRAAVDAAWVGQSAETFKDNLKADVNTINKNLERSFEIYKSEMAAIAKAMGQVDESAIVKRS